MVIVHVIMSMIVLFGKIQGSVSSIDSGFGVRFLSLFNTTSSSVSVGTAPLGIAATPDGAYVYVANQQSNTVSVIQTSTRAVIKTITGFNQPYSITMSPDGSKAYVTNYGGNSLSVITTASHTISATVGGLMGPVACTISSDGKTGYVANYGTALVPGNTVVKLNMQTFVIEAIITVGLRPAALCLSLGGTYLFVAQQNASTVGNDTIAVVSTVQNNVITTVTGFFVPTSLALTPNGSYLYICNFGTSARAGTTVSYIAIPETITSTWKPTVSSVVVGARPYSISMNKYGSYGFVTLYNDTGSQGSLVTIQLNTQSVVAPSYTLLNGPRVSVVMSDGLTMWITNQKSNAVSLVSFQNTVAVSLINSSQQITPLYTSNMFQNSFSQTIGYLVSTNGMNAPRDSFYITLSNLQQFPNCGNGLNSFAQVDCGNTLLASRYFVQGGTNQTNFYIQIPYSSIPSGPTAITIDAPTQMATLVTTAGISTIPGTLFTLSTNVVYPS